jgi:two-component system, OmpR family, response regulator QseB
MPKILIVEDEEQVARMIMTVFEEVHLDCTWARDGNEALAALAQADADVILTDLVMGGMDGIELITRLRARGSTRRVVVMTGCRDTETESPLRAAMDAGADLLLLKPFRIPELLEAVTGA